MTLDGPSSTVHVVVPAGGSGTRLWPLSRAGSPKFLHPLTGDGRSLIRATFDRLAPLASPEHSWVVTGAAHAVGISRELPEVPAGNVLVEPGPRDSAPAIGLAAALIARQDPDAVMASFAADHLIADEPTFLEVVRRAAAVAETGKLVTVGITPTGPETGFGYLRPGDPLGHDGALAVDEFVEKPSAEKAAQYVADGYLWNASMFVWKATAFLDELRRQLPELAAGLDGIVAAWDSTDADETLAKVWPTLPKVPVDNGVMEGAAARGLVATVPGDFGWNDVGDWDTLGEVLAGDENNVVVLGESSTDVVLRDVRDCVVHAGTGRTVALLGVQDVVVVDTPDAVLVARRDRAQEVKAIVDSLRGSDRQHLL